MDDNNQLEIDTIWNEAKAYIDQGNFDKAIETYKYILIRYNDSPIAVECANANLGDIYLTLKQLDLAEVHIKKAISCDPKKPDYYYLLGFVYSIQSEWKKAIVEFRVAIRVEPDNAEYLRGLGWAVFNGGNKSEGLEYLHKANELERSNVNVLLDLSNAYLITLDFEKAKIYAGNALLVDPGNGLARKTMEKIEEVQKLYKRAQSRSKKDS